jgi:nicotinic acid phosphoribosyltransferase
VLPGAFRVHLLTLWLQDFKHVEEPIDDGCTGAGEPRTGEPNKPLNVVVKLFEIEGKPCVKISDGASYRLLIACSFADQEGATRCHESECELPNYGTILTP